MSDPGLRRMLLVTAAIAVVTYGLAAMLVGTPAIVADGLTYNAAAARLLNTGAYSYLSLDLTAPEPPNAFVTPGYPLLLVPAYMLVPRVGDVFEVIAGAIPYIITLHFAAAVAAAVMIAATAHSIAGRRAGWTAGVLAALYFPFGAEAMSGWSENVSMFFAAALILLAVRLFSAETPGTVRSRAIALGLCAGLATLVRPVFALWVLLPLMVLVWTRRSDVRGALAGAVLAVLSLSLVMTPWTVRNVVSLGRFIPLSTHAGTVLLDTVGGLPLTPAETDVFLQAEAQGRDGLQVVARQRLRQDFESDPWAVISWWAGQTTKMLLVPWSSHENPARPHSVDVPRAQLPDYRLMSVGGYRAWKVVIGSTHLAVMALGWLALWRLRRRKVVWVVASLPLYLLTVCAVMGPRIRYFYPAMPAMLLLAALGACWIQARREAAGHRPWPPPPRVPWSRTTGRLT